MPTMSAEFRDFIGREPGQKRASQKSGRLELDEGRRCRSTSGPRRTPSGSASGALGRRCTQLRPSHHPRRADHYRLRLDALSPACRVYSMWCASTVPPVTMKSPKGAAVQQKGGARALQLRRLSERRYIIRPAGWGLRRIWRRRSGTGCGLSSCLKARYHEAPATDEAETAAAQRGGEPTAQQRLSGPGQTQLPPAIPNWPDRRHPGPDPATLLHLRPLEAPVYM